LKKKEIKTLKEILSIKQRKVSEEELIKNEKQLKIKMLFLFYLPLSGVIISLILYFYLHNNFTLIPFVLFSFIMLWGIDGKKQSCSECKKWDAVVWYEKKQSKRLVEKTEKYKDGETKKKEETFLVIKSLGKCQNCGALLEKEALKPISNNKKKKWFKFL